MTILIQKGKDNLPIRDDAFSAYLGFSSLNYDCMFIDYLDLVISSKEAIQALDIECCVGNINFVKRVCFNLDKPYKTGIDYPPALYKYLNRKIDVMTVKEILQTVSYQEDFSSPIFIKPVNDKEFFTGVIRSIEDFNYFKSVNNFTSIDSIMVNNVGEAYISEYVKMLSEWRCYVHNNKLVDVKNYQGNFRIHPDYEVINKMIEDYSTSKLVPVAYGLDVAVDNTGKTILVECNQMTCLGNYGLDSTKYAEMLLDNWNYYLI